MQFTDGIKKPVKDLINKAELVEGKEQSYLPWASALALTNRAPMQVELFNSRPYLPLFGCAAVAVRAGKQLTWLPVLGNKNQPIALDKLTSRDVNDSLNRCRAKTAAMVYGVGLCVYAGVHDVLQYLREVNVKPTDDLSRVEPRVELLGTKKKPYVDWTSALAAARITDPDFVWEVQFFEVLDETTGDIQPQPYVRTGDSYMVAVKVAHQGVEHTEFLPIMGTLEVKTKNGPKNLEHQPLPNPTVHDWNRAVMRCLTKGIACATGYGLGIYAREDIDNLHVDPLRKAAEITPEDLAQLEAQKAELIANIRAAITESGGKEADMVRYLGGGLDTLDITTLERGLRAASRKPEQRAAA